MSLFDLFQDDYEEKEIIRGPMNFPGSKVNSLKNILELLPYDRKYIEVFGGSAAVLLNRDSCDLEVYNDRHAGWTSLFKCLQCEETTTELLSIIDTYPNSREFFQWCKNTYHNDPDIVRAAKWFYMVQLSFGGVGRTWGFATKTPTSLMRRMEKKFPEFPKIRQRMKNVQVDNLDWREMFNRYDSHDVVWYLDPPYWGSDIYELKMKRKDHKELCDRIFELEGFVALSGYENDLYDEYPWDGVHSWDIKSSVGNNYDNAPNKYQEFLWIKEFAD